MNINRITVMEGTSHVTGFLSEQKFPPYLRLTLSLLDIELTTQTQFTGSVQFIHKLPNNTRRTKRINFTQNNFDKGLNFFCSICTGDLLEKILISLYNIPNGLLEKQLTAINPPYLNVISQEINHPELQLEFLESVRLLNPSHFMKWFYWELDALEAPSIKASTGLFKKWAIADKIIRLVGRGEINQWYLDWCAEYLCNEYADIKKELSLTEIIV